MKKLWLTASFVLTFIIIVFILSKNIHNSYEDLIIQAFENFRGIE